AQFAQVGVHAGLTFDDAGLQFLDERRARQSAQQFRSPRDEASGGEVHDVELLRHPDFRDPGIVHDPKLLGNDKGQRGGAKATPLTWMSGVNAGYPRRSVADLVATALDDVRVRV